MNNIDAKDNVCVHKNEESWNGSDTYNAWVNRFGTPEEAAKKLKENPSKKVNVLLEKFGDVQGKKIVNLMGSNGIKGVSLGLLGADITVVDFSKENEEYALDLAKAAGVDLHYVLSDVLKLDESLNEQFDIVFAEMGILHYFSDLKPFMDAAYRLLKPNGMFVIRDFHPVSTKLITSRGTTAKIRKHKVTGDYFDTSLKEKEVSYSKYSDDAEKEKVYLRLWNLGEVVTACASSNFVIKRLDEEPNLSSEVFDKGIPKTFTLTAIKLLDPDIML